MTTAAHLWAIGYDDIRCTEKTRDEITTLSERPCLDVLDMAVVTRFADGSVTLDGVPFVVATNVRRRPLARLLAGLALGAPPLTGAALGSLLRGARSAASEAVGISVDFVSEVEEMMKPGTSALFVLDQERDLDSILHGIRGFGGTVLKTTVDLARSALIQSTLAVVTTDDDTQQCREPREND